MIFRAFLCFYLFISFIENILLKHEMQKSLNLQDLRLILKKGLAPQKRDIKDSLFYLSPFTGGYFVKRYRNKNVYLTVMNPNNVLILLVCYAKKGIKGSEVINYDHLYLKKDTFFKMQKKRCL